jgi:hypothetical protein
MSKCEICGKDGFHKLSCPNNKEMQKRLLVDMMQADERDGLYNKAIPTLEGDEAEDFIRKADENVKAMRQRRCKYVKREGESCTLNDNCTYPNCKE